MKEVFRPVVGYERLYLVSNFGKVMNANTGRLLSPEKKDRRLVVKLFRDNDWESYNVNRLVANAFLGENVHGAKVEYIDGDKSNNVFTNLRWKLPKANKTTVRNGSQIKHEGRVMEWVAPVTGFYGLYKVSDLGRVFNMKTGAEVPFNDEKSRNYNRPYVDLVDKDGVTWTLSVAKLVATEFLDRYDPQKTKKIHYMNGNPWDTRVDNMTTRKVGLRLHYQELGFEEELSEIEEMEDEDDNKFYEESSFEETQYTVRSFQVKTPPPSQTYDDVVSLLNQPLF